MLKTIGSPNELAPSRNNGSRPASARNDGDGEVDEFGGNGVEHTKKSGKSKDQKTSKSQKLAKARKLSKSIKNFSKSGNLPNSGTIETGPSFLTPKAKSAFNRLLLAFIEASIL